MAMKRGAERTHKQKSELWKESDIEHLFKIIRAISDNYTLTKVPYASLVDGVFQNYNKDRPNNVPERTVYAIRRTIAHKIRSVWSHYYEVKKTSNGFEYVPKTSFAEFMKTHPKYLIFKTSHADIEAFHTYYHKTYNGIIVDTKKRIPQCRERIPPPFKVFTGNITQSQGSTQPFSPEEETEDFSFERRLIQELKTNDPELYQEIILAQVRRLFKKATREFDIYERHLLSEYTLASSVPDTFYSSVPITVPKEDTDDLQPTVYTHAAIFGDSDEEDDEDEEETSELTAATISKYMAEDAEDEYEFDL